MSTERKEMNPSDNLETDFENSIKDKDAGSLLEMISEVEFRKQKYANLSKDEILDRLIMTEMLLSELKNPEKNIDLWYYVSDEDECKYLTNESPKIGFYNPQEVQTDRSPFTVVIPKKMLFSDGEINIRVPKCMERIFPEIKYGDSPIKINLGAWLI